VSSERPQVDDGIRLYDVPRGPGDGGARSAATTDAIRIVTGLFEHAPAAG
jgi:hypothetical protein